MKKNRLSFLDKAESTLKALDKCRFEVKQYSDGDHYVSCHISAGPIENKDYAELLAADFNSLVESRKKDIEKAIGEACYAIDNILSQGKEKIVSAIIGKKEKVIYTDSSTQKPIIDVDIDVEKSVRDMGATG